MRIYILKIADFGGSKIILTTPQGPSTIMGSRVSGTLYYLAPEILQELTITGTNYCFSHNARTTVKTDIYSYGLILYEIFFKKIPHKEIFTNNPFDKAKEIVICNMLQQNIHNELIKFNKNKNLMEIIETCLYTHDRYESLKIPATLINIEAKELNLF